MKPVMHAHRRPYLPPEEPEADRLSTHLLTAAILVVFLLVFVVPTVLGWHG